MEKELNHDNPEVKTPPPLIFLGFGLFGIVLHYLKPENPINFSLLL